MAKLAEKRLAEGAAKAHTRDSLQALSKLGELDDGRYRIVNQPPVVIPLRDLAPELTPDRLSKLIREQFTAYRASLQPDMRHLLGHFEVVDVARKVVGVGSVGTRCFIVLLQGRDASDPLFLQVKEATNSVLEEHLPRSRYRQHGQRVVQGQKLMQATSDIYLGWARGVDVNRHFYWRQLRDMKGSVADRGDDPARAHPVRAALRLDDGPCARPVRGPGRDRRLSRPRRRVRPRDHRLLRAVRRPE